MTATVHTLRPEKPSLKPLMTLVAPGLNAVNRVILDRMQSEVALIPETRERTTLGLLGQGRRLNLECDVIARYVERMVSPYAGGAIDDPGSG